MLLPFKDRIVYDGLLASHNIVFGGGIKRRLNDSYREAKARQGVITALPPDSQAPAISEKQSARSSKRDGHPIARREQKAGGT